jgi:hypothetical protein
LVLARPLWALLLLHSWQLLGQNRRSAWFAWSIEAGLLLLTTSSALGLLLLLAGFTVATVRGRRMLMSLDPLYALLVIVVLVLPYVIWVLRAGALTMPAWPAISDFSTRAPQWAAIKRDAGDVRHRAAGILSSWLPAGAKMRHIPATGRLWRDFVFSSPSPRRCSEACSRACSI